MVEGDEALLILKYKSFKRCVFPTPLGAFIEIALTLELLSERLFKIISRALSYFLYSLCSNVGF